MSASGGVSYLWLGTRFSVDAIFGTGLRDDLTLPDGSAVPNGDHTPSYTQINFGLSHDFEIAGSGPLTVRFDVINVADKVYQIRSGIGHWCLCAAVRTATWVLRRTGVEVLRFRQAMATSGASPLKSSR